MAGSAEPHSSSYRLRTIEERRERENQRQRHRAGNDDNRHYRNTAHWWYSNDHVVDNARNDTQNDPVDNARSRGEHSGQYSVESSVDSVTGGGGTRDCFRVDCFARGYQQAAQHCLGVLAGSMPLWLIVK